MIEQRLARLEREARVWRVFALVSVGVACFLALRPLLLPARAEVRARAFVVVDEAGLEVARLSSETGGGRLLLHAPAARADVVVGAFGEIAGLALRGSETVWANLSVGRSGQPALTLSNLDGENRVLTGIDGKGEGVLVLWSSDAKQHAILRPRSDTTLMVGDGKAEKDALPRGLGD